MGGANPADGAKIQPHSRGIAIVALGVLVLSPDGLLTTLVGADIWTMLFWRGLLMALAFTVFSLVRRRRDQRRDTASARPLISRQTLGPTLGIAMLFTGSSIAFVTAIVTTSVANTLFLITVAPLFAAAFARVFLKEPVAPRTLVAIVVTVVVLHLFIDLLRLLLLVAVAVVVVVAIVDVMITTTTATTTRSSSSIGIAKAIATPMMIVVVVVVVAVDVASVLRHSTLPPLTLLMQFCSLCCICVAS